MKILRNNKGYSLIEIIAGIPLTVLVFTIFAIGILHFVTTFQEVKLYNQLSQDLFDAIEIMRHGYMYDGVTDDEGLIGFTTAKKVQMGTSRKSIKVAPLATKINLEGKYALPRLRETVRWPSSIGCLNASRTERGNSLNSSRNSTPLCARLISPG